MSNTLTPSDAIVQAAFTGRNPPALDSVEAGDTFAAGVTVALVANASTTHALNSTFSDVEVESALNTLGTKINSILAALKEYKIMATS